MPFADFTSVATDEALVPRVMQQQGFAVLSAPSVVRLLGMAAPDLSRIQSSWNDLPPDHYLKDGGRYRRRRHASMVVDESLDVQWVPHRAHWQPLTYNALHGGMQRWFEPLATHNGQDLVWTSLVKLVATMANQMAAQPKWFAEVHQFRIDTTDGIGRPTPEGAHRDGVDFVAVFMVGRNGIKGGETRVFEANGPNGQRFTLLEPWSMLLLDDQRVIHETTPIQPLVANAPSWRDTLVITLRSGGFLE